MVGFVNLVKLCVGAEGIEDLTAWQKTRPALNAQGLPQHVTRMWPKRAEEILAGGSLYWVFKGWLLARQPIRALEEATGEDGVLRCALVLDPAIIRTDPVPRRPFQGWRYLDPADSPRDLMPGRRHEEPLPVALQAALAELGVR